MANLPATHHLSYRPQGLFALLSLLLPRTRTCPCGFQLDRGVCPVARQQLPGVWS
jgi:hypothetical protein